MITTLSLRGIDEKPGVGSMLEGVTRYLDPTLFRSIEIEWPAQYGPASGIGGISFARSLKLGLPMVVDAIRNDPNPVVGLGYSGGAALWKIVMSEIEAGVHGSDLDVLALGQIADPFRPIGNGAPVSAGWGIAGKMPVKVLDFQIAALNDVITCCDPHSPLRAFSDFTSAYSAADFNGWTHDLVDRIEQNRWQGIAIGPADPVAAWQQFTKARADLMGYLYQGHHTSYALGGDHAPTAILAKSLNAWAAGRRAAGLVA